MSYLAAWCLLSLLGCAVWFRLTRFLEADDVDTTTPANDGGSLRPVHVIRLAPDAAEENDAAIGAMVSTTVGSE